MGRWTKGMVGLVIIALAVGFLGVGIKSEINSRIVKKTLAVNPEDSNYNTNKFKNSYMPELKGMKRVDRKSEVYSKSIPTLNNFFEINSPENAHQVTYTEISFGEYEIRNGMTEKWHCWKMTATSERYFNPPRGNFYYCVVYNYHKRVQSEVAAEFHHAIFAKVSKPEWQKYEGSNWDIADDKDNYFLSLRDPKLFDIYTNEFDKSGVISTKDLYQAEYMWYVTKENPEWRVGVQKIDCLNLLNNGGKEDTPAEIYAKCFFPDGGEFQGAGEGVEVKKNKTGPPFVVIPGKSVFKNAEAAKYGSKRPQLTFTLQKMTTARGAGYRDKNYVYFVADKPAQKPSHPNLAIKMIDCSTDNPIIALNKLPSAIDDYVVGYGLLGFTEVRIVLEKISLFNNYINVYYTKGPYDPEAGCPPDNDLDLDKLKADGVEIVSRDEGEGTGECGYSILSPSTIITYVQCVVIQGLVDLLKLVSTWLEDAAGMTYHRARDTGMAIWRSPPVWAKALGIQTAYAEESVPLSRQLVLWNTESRKPEITAALTAYRAMLGFIDAFLIFALLFIAFANIFRWNIDTYTVKKSLPGLIMGVIGANISWFIIVALLDVASLATVTLCQGSSAIDTANKLIGTFIGDAKGFTTDYANLGFGEFLLYFILLLALIVMFAWMAIVLLIRRIYILLLYAVAPLAFLALGFPMTTQYFKKWWGEFAKWVFMLPVMFFILWIATQFKGNGPLGFEDIFRVVMILALCFAAVKVPFSLGGFAAGAVGFANQRFRQAGGVATNLGKAGGKWAGQTADRGTKGIFTRPFRAIGTYREQSKENYQGYLEGQKAKATNMAQKMRLFGKRPAADAEVRLHNQHVAKLSKLHDENGDDSIDLQNAIAKTNGSKAPWAKEQRQAAVFKLYEKGMIGDILNKNSSKVHEDVVKGLGFTDRTDYKEKISKHIAKGDMAQAYKNLLAQIHNSDSGKADKKATNAAIQFEGMLFKKGHMNNLKLVESDGTGGKRFTSQKEQVDGAFAVMKKMGAMNLARNLPADAFLRMDSRGNYRQTPLLKKALAEHKKNQAGALRLGKTPLRTDEVGILHNMYQYRKGMSDEAKDVFEELRRLGHVHV